MGRDLLFESIKTILNVIFIVGGVFSIIIAFLSLFKPALLQKIRNTGQRVLVNLEEMLAKNHIVWGIIYLIIGIILIYFSIAINKLS
ncbi:MAG: hypothetical protein B6D55_01735 [Candidatus Omnitrophica bacterium 4484_70.2]|nr:MAG: hypothetical protein B6D55_01735 [Candidatus Omnitrophica bacterium 4484_70.2]